MEEYYDLIERSMNEPGKARRDEARKVILDKSKIQ